MTMPICCCLMELLDTMQKEEVIAQKAMCNIVQVGSLLSTAAVACETSSRSSWNRS